MSAGLAHLAKDFVAVFPGSEYVVALALMAILLLGPVFLVASIVTAIVQKARGKPLRPLPEIIGWKIGEAADWISGRRP